MYNFHDLHNIDFKVNDDLIVFGRAKCDTDDDRYYDPQCYAYEGSGDDLITPVYNPPVRPKWDNEPEDTELCDDDEDCRDSGSGMYFEGLYLPQRFGAEVTQPTLIIAFLKLRNVIFVQ